MNEEKIGATDPKVESAVSGKRIEKVASEEYKLTNESKQNLRFPSEQTLLSKRMHSIDKNNEFNIKRQKFDENSRVPSNPNLHSPPPIFAVDR
jgi:hypothetical protein